MIISEFVNFARLPSPTFALCEIISMINDLVESRKLINDKITYKFKSNVDEHDFVCDITQINQIMVNLLLNAEESLQEVKSDSHIDVEILVNEENTIIVCC